MRRRETTEPISPGRFSLPLVSLRLVVVAFYKQPLSVWHRQNIKNIYLSRKRIYELLALNLSLNFHFVDVTPLLEPTTNFVWKP